jgi:hypothetical protein
VKTTRNIAVLSVVAFGALICSCTTQGALESKGLAAETLTPWLPSLATETDYQKLMRSDATTNTTFVKITVDHKAQGTPVYFQNTAKYPFHQPFLSENIERFRGRSFTMDEILFGATKEVSAGALYWAPDVTLFAEPGVLGFEIYFKDVVPIDEIVTVYNRLKQTAPFAVSKLTFLFSDTAQFFQNKAKLDAVNIPSARISLILGRSDVTRVYNAATSYGYLKSMTPAEFATGNFTNKDILVLSTVPLDIGPLSGIITTEPQVPHSHVIFRAVNQKIPDVYIPNGLGLTFINRNIGKLVKFEATAEGTVSIQSAAQVPNLEALADSYFKTRVPQLPELRADVANSAFYQWSKP